MVVLRSVVVFINVKVMFTFVQTCKLVLSEYEYQLFRPSKVYLRRRVCMALTAITDDLYFHGVTDAVS